MEEGKGVALAILGIVAVVAIFGLVLLFTSSKTGKVFGVQDDIAQCEAELNSGSLTLWCQDFLSEYYAAQQYRQIGGTTQPQYTDGQGYY